ncbi:MAG TPA: selenoneine biosynthesis selenosugar synthase SenB [Albitalea sp.]
MNKPRVRIVSPALASANNGNWHTAARWQRFLAPLAEVDVALDWQGEAVDALIALHARRSAGAIARFHAAQPERALALVLTGTDLYRDLPADASARHSLDCATHVVVLQQEAMHRLDAATRARARVIVQSATRLRRKHKSAGPIVLTAVGHLREEKDPATLMRAARLLPAASAIELIHIGNALDPALADAARATMQACPHYRWLGGLAPAATRRRIAAAHALVHTSVMEGGANVVIEAVRSGVPVLASRIDGNVGLLGRGYDGYFTAGDAPALAALMQRFASDAGFAEHLAAQCAEREPLFAPATERAAVKGLLRDMLRHVGATIPPPLPPHRTSP